MIGTLLYRFFDETMPNMFVCANSGIVPVCSMQLCRIFACYHRTDIRLFESRVALNTCLFRFTCFARDTAAAKNFQAFI